MMQKFSRLAKEKWVLIRILILIPLWVGNISLLNPNKKSMTVVINAGHGGTDPGCHGVKHWEKDVTLAISLKLGKYIEQNLPDVKVEYTRITDIFVPLNEIAAHANKNNADLFICIHCNASVKHEIFGSETYAMGLHKTKGNLDVAKRENASILYEEDYQKKYEGFDPSSDEANIIFSMYQNAFLEKSLSFAAKVQEQFSRIGRSDKGVKQAGFLVLWKTKMPAVLIETGFLTNPAEEKFLGSSKGQDMMARAIFSAFKKYKAEQLGETITWTDDIKTPANIEKEINDEKIEREKQEEKERMEQEKLEKEKLEKAKADKEKAIKDSIANIGKPEKPKDKVEDQKTEGIWFSVQVAHSNKKIPLNSKQFSGVPEIKEMEEKDSFKYISGKFRSTESALSHQKVMRAKGYSDAFVVAYFGDRKIPVKEARELLKNKEQQP
jgi:N-acetylmuramoyl-L-alanine amidase